MYDFLDDHGQAAIDHMNLKVAQDTMSREAPASHFAWPETKKYAMATEDDVITSAVYFGLFGGQLDEGQQEKIAERLSRAIKAFDIQGKIDKIAVLPAYHNLSTQDIMELEREDTPGARLKRKLMKAGLYGAVGGGAGAALSRLTTKKISPWWVAIPASLAAGVGLAKASQRLVDAMEIDRSLKAALDNADTDILTHAPPDRRTYAKLLKKAAEKAGAAVPDVVDEYAADTYGDRLSIGLLMRTAISEDYGPLQEKRGTVPPEQFANELYELDKRTGIVVNNRIPDAFYTTFGVTEKRGSAMMVVDDEDVTPDFIDKIPEHKDVLNRVLDTHVVNAVCARPSSFMNLTPIKQIIIVREIRKATKGG